MSLLPYKVTAIKDFDATGQNVMPYASVSVLNKTGGYAALKTDETGATPLGNPFDCDVNGEKEFWILGGEYIITVDGGQSWEIHLSGASDIQMIENVAALASTPAVAGRTYYLNEYHAGVGKGGGSLLAYSSGASPDNVFTFASATAGVLFKRINYMFIDSTFAGGRADGSTDDLDAINFMLIAVAANGISRCYLPSGTSCTSGQITIPKGVTLTGAGAGGNWATGDGVPWGSSPSFASRLLYTGSTSINIIALGDGVFDAGVSDLYIDGGRTTTQIYQWSDAFNASTTLPATVIGVRLTSTLGTKMSNVRIQNCTYGMFFDSASIRSNAFGRFSDIIIQTVNIGVLMSGIYDQSPVSNQGFTNLKVTGYWNRGIDFRVAADSNSFFNVYMSASIPGSIGIYYNSSSPGIDQGIGCNNFYGLIMDLFNPSPGDNGMRCIKVGLTAPGSSYIVGGFLSPVTNNHYTLVTPEILPGGILVWSNTVAPAYTVSESSLWNGGNITVNNTGSYVAASGLTTFFNANLWSSRYDTNAVVPNFKVASKIVKIEWVIRWSPTTTSGGVQLYDNTTGAVCSANIEPGTTAARTDIQDVTDFFLPMAVGPTNYAAPADKQIVIRAKGDGASGAVINRSYLRIITSSVA